MTDAYLEYYAGRRIMVTGGLGFIGSNLVRRLVDLGAHVLVVDSLFPDYGGNLYNIHGIEDRISVNISDVRDETSMDVLVRRCEIIFNLAGQVSHIDSMRDPYTDLEINCRAQLSMLEACRKHNPSVRVVFAGTRQVYGRGVLPPALQQRVRRSFLLAASHQRVWPATADPAQPAGLHRLVHTARPRRTRDPGVRRRLPAARLRIRRRCLGVSNRCHGEVFNVGGDEPVSHRDLVSVLVATAGSGSVRFVEWPPDKKRIDIGSFYSDSTRFRQTTGWRPTVDLREGFKRTLAYYREHLPHYVEDAATAAETVP